MSMKTIRHESDVSNDGVDIPILSVDESLSVEERMTDNAVENILPARYLDKNEDGETTETPAELFERVADNVATAEYQFAQEQGLTSEEAHERFEEWKGEFEGMMKTLRFMPNSPTLMNAGLSLQQLSACFVVEPKDDMTDILETVKDAGLIFKSGGGVGYSFSHLRPKGTLVSSTKGYSSGPISFMRLFDEVCNQVKQGGKRRGAQMAIMRVDHPDIGRFAVSKREEGALSNFNISAAITDEFKEAVEEDKHYTLYSPQGDYEEPFETAEATATFYSPEYEDAPESIVDENLWRDYADSIEAWDWENEETVSFREKWEKQAYYFPEEGDELVLPARFIWDLLIDGAWRNGEPGLFYIDETNREHSFDIEEHPEYAINATNPCAEQPLCEYEACNLAHINLSLMVRRDAQNFDEWYDEQEHDYHSRENAVVDYVNESVNFDELDRVIESGVRFLDNVVTMSDFPLEEIENRVDDMRKIGLGIMGWSQMLYQMGIRYGSGESFSAARHLMSYIDTRATHSSHNLAKERGSFDVWSKSKYANPTEHREWFKSHTQQEAEDWEDGYPIRNHNVTTVAPTGTTSMLADTSGGIEPVHSVAYKKNVGEDIQGDEMLVEFDSYFIKALEANEDQMEYAVDEIKKLAAEQMTNNEWRGVDGLPIPEELKKIFVTTNDLTSREHGLMQRAFQDAVDSGISKTINLPKQATHSDVHDAYMLALSDDEVGSPIKGMTVYRDQSRMEQVVTTQEHSDKEIEQAVELLESVGYEVTDE